jgi:hypothetical protein
MFCKEGFIGVQKDGKYFGIGCSINLFFYQLLTSIHNLFTPPIYNKVKMHTKVNYSSKKKSTIYGQHSKFDLYMGQHKKMGNDKICK